MAASCCCSMALSSLFGPDLPLLRFVAGFVVTGFPLVFTVHFVLFCFCDNPVRTVWIHLFGGFLLSSVPWTFFASSPYVISVLLMFRSSLTIMGTTLWCMFFVLPHTHGKLVKTSWFSIANISACVVIAVGQLHLANQCVPYATVWTSWILQIIFWSTVFVTVLHKVPVQQE